LGAIINQANPAKNQTKTRKLIFTQTELDDAEEIDETTETQNSLTEPTSKPITRNAKFKKTRKAERQPQNAKPTMRRNSTSKGASQKQQFTGNGSRPIRLSGF
jgi:hypothetical protein